MKIISILIFLQVTFIDMSAQNHRGKDMEQLIALNATFIHNFVTNDVASHDKIIHAQFVCINSEGKYIKRDDYLDAWAHGYDGFRYWDYRDEKIKIFGSTALVRAQNKYVFIKDGKEITGMAMYTDVYIKENGEWKCIQAQIGKVSPANYAGDETIVRKYE